MIDQRKLLAANIKAFRDANSLSQEEFAEDCGMCSKMVKEYLIHLKRISKE